MSKLPVSVCIIAKNEEKHIENCLRSLLPYGMEIVVADTGSTDNTKQIARKYTDHVYDFEWKDDFAAARNFAASRASNNWILVLDCDEQVQSADAAQMRICMQKNPKSVGVVEILNVYSRDGKESILSNEVPRFYNRNYYDYRFRVHEQITPAGTVDFDRVVIESFRLPVTVRHYGYDIPQEEMFRKQKRNLELLEASIGENEGMDDYIYFQIGQSYNALQKFDEAIKAYDMSLECNRNPQKKFLIICLEAYTECLLREKRDEDAYRLLDMNRTYLTTAKLRYLFGKAAYLCRDYETAYLFLSGAVQASDADTLGEDIFDAYSRIFAICKSAGNMEKLEEYKKKLAEYGDRHGKKIIFEEEQTEQI